MSDWLPKDLKVSSEQFPAERTQQRLRFSAAWRRLSVPAPEPPISASVRRHDHLNPKTNTEHGLTLVCRLHINHQPVSKRDNLNL